MTRARRREPSAVGMVRVLLAILAAVPGCAPPPLSSFDASRALGTVQVGDVVAVAGAGEALGRPRPVGLDGSLDLPSCGRVAIGGLSVAAARTLVDATVVTCGHPQARAEITLQPRPILLFAGPACDGDLDALNRASCPESVVDYQPGLTVLKLLTTDLRLRALLPRRVQLRRHFYLYSLDLEAVRAGRDKDEPLLPFDMVFVRGEDSPLRPPPPAPEAPPVPAEDLGAKSCGELMLLRIGRSRRQGEAAAKPVLDVLSGVCLHTPDVHASLRAACAAAARLRQELLAEGKGTRHPLVLDVDAELRACPDPASE